MLKTSRIILGSLEGFLALAGRPGCHCRLYLLDAAGDRCDRMIILAMTFAYRAYPSNR